MPGRFVSAAERRQAVDAMHKTYTPKDSCALRFEHRSTLEPACFGVPSAAAALGAPSQADDEATLSLRSSVSLCGLLFFVFFVIRSASRTTPTCKTR